MSEENNIYESKDSRYTQAPDVTPSYGGGSADYGSGKGQGKGLGIASMVCGIVSIVTICCVPYVPAILGVVAVVLGIIQIVKNESKGMAIAGIICGAVGLVVYVVLFAIGMAVINSGEYSEILRQLQELQ